MFFDGLQKSGFDKRLVEASLMNNAGLLLKSKHSGGDDSFAESVFAADITGLSDVSSYSNVKIDSTGAQILASGYAGVTEDLTDSDGNGIAVSSDNSPCKLLTINPTGFGTLSSIVIRMSSSAAGMFQYPDQLLLYCDDVLVSESDEVVSAGSGINVDITFAFESIELDPNKGYDVYFKSRNPAERRIKSATITVTPIVYTSGIVILNEIMLQSGHSRTAFYVYSSGSAPDVMVKLGDGSYESVAERISKQAVSQTGAACTARRYECEFLPGTYESITIKIEMNAADIVVFGCFGAIL